MLGQEVQEIEKILLQFNKLTYIPHDAKKFSFVISCKVAIYLG